MLNKFLFKLALKYQWIGRFIAGNDGFDFKKQQEAEKDPRNYIMGASPLIKKILKENGDWQDIIIEKEPQSGALETMGCTGFSLLSIIEILHKFKWAEEVNKSDRFTNKMSGVTANGNSMNTVLESVRKNHGAVNQSDWPNNVDKLTWAQYYSAIPQEIKDKGLMWLKDYEIGYEAVYNTKQAILEALKFSPLYIAIYAWYLKDGLYVAVGNPNHAGVLVGGNNDYGIVFDSYDPFIKKVSWNNIFFPKLITFNKKKEVFNPQAIQKLIARGLEYLQRPESRGELYKISSDGLVYKAGQELTNDLIKEKATQGKLVGISEKDWYKLLI